MGYRAHTPVTNPLKKTRNPLPKVRDFGFFKRIRHWGVGSIAHSLYTGVPYIRICGAAKLNMRFRGVSLSRENRLFVNQVGPASPPWCTAGRERQRGGRQRVERQRGKRKRGERQRVEQERVEQQHVEQQHVEQQHGEQHRGER